MYAMNYAGNFMHGNLLISRVSILFTIKITSQEQKSSEHFLMTSHKRYNDDGYGFQNQ